MQGADEIALTKLDVLSYLDKIPVCVAYEVNGVRTDKFPTGKALADAKPVYIYLDGWKEDISKVRNYADLPTNAQKYIDFIRDTLGCNIKYVSVGAARDEYFIMD